MSIIIDWETETTAASSLTDERKGFDGLKPERLERGVDAGESVVAV